MSRLTKPLPVSIVLGILVLAFQFTNVATFANFTGISFGFLLLTLLIHELGHVLFGVWAGYRFNFLTIGPLTIENSDRMHIKANDSWFLFGGAASCSPLTDDLTAIAKQHKLFAAGGPVFSAAAALISLSIGIPMDLDLAIYLGLFNLAIFIVTIYPTNGALKSDGGVLLELSRGGEQTKEFLVSLLLLKEMNSPLHPSEWSEELIDRVKTMKPSSDNIMIAYMIFYYTLLKDGYDCASALIEPYKQIPVTKKNKLSLQFISHIRQLDSIFSGNKNLEEMKKLHEYLSPLEPVSYKRSEAILAKLKGDEQQAHQKIAEVLKETKKRKKIYGFFYAEEQLTELLKTKQ